MIERRPKTSRILIAVLLPLSLCACNVDQHKDIAAYRQVIDHQKPIQTPIEPGQTVTLAMALQLANQNEEQLSIQGESYIQALAEKDEAFAAFIPSINLEPTYTIQNKTSNTFGGTTTNSREIPITAQVGFNPVSDYHAILSAKSTIEQRKQLLLDLQQTVLQDVAQTYYAVLTNEQSVVVLQDSLKVQEENLRLAREKLRVGTGRQLDVAEAESELASTQVSMTQARANVRNSRSMLAYLLDAPVADNPLTDSFNPPGTTLNLAQWTALAESRRQDLAADDAAVSAARQNVEVAWGQYYPTIDLSASYALLGSGDTPGGSWIFAASLVQPLFDSGIIRDEVRIAWSEYRQAALAQAQLRRQIDESMSEAVTDYQLALQETRDLTVEEKAAQSQYDISQKSFKTGQVTFLDVLVAQENLLTVQLQLATEQFTAKTAWFNLLRAAGTLKLTAANVSAAQPTTQASTQPSSRPAGPRPDNNSTPNTSPHPIPPSITAAAITPR